MHRTRIAPAVGLGLAALLAVAPAANAKSQGGPLPNLAVTKVSKPPATEKVGAKLKVAIKVRDKGDAKAGKSKLAVYLGKGKKHNKKKDKRLKSVKLKALAPGKAAKRKLTLTIPLQTVAGSYRLIVCADAKKKVKESKERDNCRATRKFSVPAPGPAFTMTDQVEWIFNDARNFEEINAGTPISATLRAANGLPGQAGYTRSELAPQGFATGTTTVLDYSNAITNSEDDGEVTVPLPFAFPFGGISEQFASVSTNGWVGFGTSPAYDYWGDAQNSDYRGIPFVVGELERGIMSAWSDLNLEDVESAGTGTVRMVVPADNSFVAFQWDTAQYNVGVPRRTAQLVLFPDGSFRFDYPGVNAPGGNKTFVGYSLGTAPASLQAVSTNVESLPTNSLLFTPNAVSAGSNLAAGQATLTLPAGSVFIAADPGCALSQAPTAAAGGLVTCSTPTLAVGQQAAWNVQFATPPNAPGETDPANFRYKGELHAGSAALVDGDEIDPLNGDLEATTLKINAAYGGPPTPQVGEAALFNVEVRANEGGLDEPTITFALPANTTLNSILNASQPLPCGAVSGGQVTCQLASGTRLNHLTVTVTPQTAAKGQPLVLGITAASLNTAPASATAESPPVGP
jgi:hypothetical protein